MPVNINGTVHTPRLGDGTPCNVYEYDGTNWVEIHTDATVGETIDLGTDNASDSSANESGVYGTTKAEIHGLRATLSQNYGGDATYAVSRTGSGTALSSQVDITGASAGDTIEVMLDSPRASGMSISLQIARTDGATYGRGRNENVTYPFSGAELDIENGVYSASMSLSTSNRYNFSSITPILSSP